MRGVSEQRFYPSRDELDPFLRYVTSQRTGDARAVYRAWLEERGDARAELLMLEEALLEGRPPDDFAIARWRASEILSDPTVRAWWRSVSVIAPIRACGSAAREEPEVRFAFSCPRAWEMLDPTGVPNVRHCTTCATDVHLSRSRAEAEERARRGECIAVPREIVGAVASEVTRFVTGHPDVAALWASKIFGDS